MKLDGPAAAGSSIRPAGKQSSGPAGAPDGFRGAIARPSAGRPSLFERWLLRCVLEACGNPAVRIVLWDGDSVCTSPTPPVGSFLIRDRRTLRKLAMQPNVAFGDGYAEGRIEIDGDLTEVLCAISRSLTDGRPQGLISRMFSRVPRARRSHTISASRDSVHHHYDIGNEFYRLWLDKQLVYTCAYYSDPKLGLDEAQIVKMDYICRKLRLRSGESVIEAGCGWGGLALHMARRYGVAVRAFNLSREQVRYAREWARSEGLDRRVDFIEDDYRNASGQCDAFVSVGMLEHVGVENYHELGRVIDRVLTRDGRGLIHTIGRNAPRPLDPWTDKRIFPGAYPPALSEMMGIFEPWRFSILDVENIRLHYARTLEHWLERFQNVAGRVAEMFDEKFVRTWRLYLAGSIAAFRIGSLQLFQVVFARETNNDVPWTRDYMYGTTYIE